MQDVEMHLPDSSYQSECFDADKVADYAMLMMLAARG
jgi:hypothetical protein